MSDRTVASANGVRLASVFRPECMGMIPNQATKEAVFSQLLGSLANVHVVSSEQIPALLHALMERERSGTTALGKGLAMPHLRTEAVHRFVGAIGLAPNGVDFRSLDGVPTKLIFLLLGPYDQREQHFELMGRLSALMRDKTTLMFLQGHRAPHEVCEYLADLDARAGDASRSAAADVADALWKQPARSTGRAQCSNNLPLTRATDTNPKR